MHVHELNPWRTLIALSIFVIILIVGFITMTKPLITYKLNMNQSLEDLDKSEAFFYPWQLDSFINNKMSDVVLFDIRDNFNFGQGHIPGAENMSANNLIREENIERLEKLNEQNITVVLYGDNQLQANAPWMLFREVGFNNVKILLGGYQYYIQNKDDLLSSRTSNTFEKGIPRYDFAKLAAPKDGSEINTSMDKKPVVVQRRQKTNTVVGGC